MRVTQCCCCFSLRTGTLILLWLDLIFLIPRIVEGLAMSFQHQKQDTSLLTFYLPWGILSLVIVIYGLVAVEKNRPSYLLPYIGLCIVNLVLQILVILLLLGGITTLRQLIMEYLVDRSAISRQDALKLYDTMVSIIIFCIIFSICLTMYYLMVVYSYYKEMQEVALGTRGGIVYSSAPHQPSKEEFAATHGNQANSVLLSNDLPPAYNSSVKQGDNYSQQVGAYPQPVGAYPQQVGAYPQQVGAYPQQVGTYPQENLIYPHLSVPK